MSLTQSGRPDNLNSGYVFQHNRSGVFYKIVGIVFDAERDCEQVLYENPKTKLKFTRTPENFLELIEIPGRVVLVPRFEYSEEQTRIAFNLPGSSDA